MRDKNGITICVGDVIRWKTWDSDDFKTWTFTGLVLSDGVVYLGGGIDFGLGIGKIISYESVIEESENNDSDDAGILKIGKASDLSNYIENFGA